MTELNKRGTFAKPGGVKKHAAPATRVVALLMPDLRNTEIFQAIGGEIASLARVHNYSLIWGGSGEPELDADSYPQHAFLGSTNYRGSAYLRQSGESLKPE